MRQQSSPNLLGRLPEGSKVLLIRLRSLGDCVLTTPAIAVLNSSRPDLRIGVVVEDRFRAVFENNPAISELLPPSNSAAARFHPSLCLNLHGGTRSLGLTLASFAHFRAGFEHYRHASAYNVRIPRAQEILGEERVVHTAEHLASAMFYLGAHPQTVPQARLYAKPLNTRRTPYAVVHPFAATAEKTWPAGCFLNAARHLQDQHGLTPVILAGPDDDTSAFDAFEIARLPLAESMSLIAGASFFLGNDSGPAHIAAAYSIPLVVIFGPSDHIVWAPWRCPSAHVLKNAEISSISPAEVTAAIDSTRVPQ